MKTRFYLSLFIGLFFAIGLSAKNPETTVFSNVEVTASGTIKELTTFMTETNEPLQRSIYKYDLSGNIQEKLTYKWDGDNGWAGLQKLEYTYSEENKDKPTTLTYTKWDNKAGDWAKKSRIVSYSYDTDGKAIITVDKN